MGIVDRGNGLGGERIELFDYTTKSAVSIADTEKLINSTITEVKQLPRDHKKWCITNRYDGVYYFNDPLTLVQGVSDAKAALLAGVGIGSISKLAKLSKNAIEEAVKIQGISASGLSAMVADAESKAVAKRVPPIKYLLDDDNPFWKNMDRKRTSLWRRPG